MFVVKSIVIKINGQVYGYISWASFFNIDFLEYSDWFRSNSHVHITHSWWDGGRCAARVFTYNLWPQQSLLNWLNLSVFISGNDFQYLLQYWVWLFLKLFLHSVRNNSILQTKCTPVVPKNRAFVLSQKPVLKKSELCTILFVEFYIGNDLHIYIYI